MASKICTNCKCEKDDRQFYVRTDSSGSRPSTQCRDCRRAYWREWYQRNAEHMRQYHREYRAL